MITITIDVVFTDTLRFDIMNRLIINKYMPTKNIVSFNFGIDSKLNFATALSKITPNLGLLSFTKIFTLPLYMESSNIIIKAVSYLMSNNYILHSSLKL